MSNAWVTCLIQGDNSWKRLLIPHKRLSLIHISGVTGTVNLTYSKDLFTYQSATAETSVNAGTVSMTLGSYGSVNKRASGTAVSYIHLDVYKRQVIETVPAFTLVSAVAD